MQPGNDGFGATPAEMCKNLKNSLVEQRWKHSSEKAPPICNHSRHDLVRRNFEINVFAPLDLT